MNVTKNLDKVVTVASIFAMGLATGAVCSSHQFRKQLKKISEHDNAIRDELLAMVETLKKHE